MVTTDHPSEKSKCDFSENDKRTCTYRLMSQAFTLTHNHTGYNKTEIMGPEYFLNRYLSTKCRIILVQADETCLRDRAVIIPVGLLGIFSYPHNKTCQADIQPPVRRSGPR